MRRLGGWVAASVALCALAVVPVVSRAGSCATDWTSFQHDVNHSANACSAIDTVSASVLHPAWFQPTSGDVTAEPAVANGGVYVGDGDGTFYAFTTGGAVKWTRDLRDGHTPSYGYITSSAAIDNGTVYVGSGGTVFALDATTGAVVWKNELATTPDEEVESSPLVWTRPDGVREVIVGNDANEDKNVTHTGLFALDANDGHILWAYDPQDGQTYDGPLPAAGNNGCGDVWGSPALDAQTDQAFFPVGNCDAPNGTDYQRLIAVDATTGVQQWVFTEPAANHGPDDDFGSSPVVAHNLGLVVQAGKSGWVYGISEQTGQPAFPPVRAAEWGHAIATSLGGFIGSGATGPVGGDTVFYANSAVPVPFNSNDLQDGIDTGLATDPTRGTSLHAIDLTTGKVLWQAAQQPPSWAPVSYSNGLVYAPATTGFALNIFDASTGVLLKSTPLGAAPSSGVAVSGDSIYFGAGTYFGTGAKYPPQNTGVWSFTTAPAS